MKIILYYDVTQSYVILFELWLHDEEGPSRHLSVREELVEAVVSSAQVCIAQLLVTGARRSSFQQVVATSVHT